MFNFEKLRTYQESLDFINNVYTLSLDFPKEELFGITAQLRRASVSIALNIAEGTSRTKKDFSHFLDLSRGSCYECTALLSIALMRKYINQPEYNTLYEFCDKLSRMISKLKQTLR